MNFYKSALIFILGTALASFAHSNPKKKVVLNREGKNYAFNLCDLEAYIKKEYNCSLDIRVNEPEVLNAIGPVLVIHDPAYTQFNNLSGKISHQAWIYIQNKAYQEFHHILKEVTHAYWMVGLLTSGSLVPAVSISLFQHGSAQATLMRMATLGMVGGLLYATCRLAKRPIYTLDQGNSQKCPLGFVEISHDEEFVYIQTSYPLTRLQRAE